MKNRWWLYVFVGVILISVLLWWIIQPDPGDEIILEPNPNGSLNHWSIGGSDASASVEQGQDLNKNAFSKVHTFRATLTSGTVLTKVNKVSATFKHCSGSKQTGCTIDADCGANQTCDPAELLVTRRTGTPDTFVWQLNGGLLIAKSKLNAKLWRAELCGKLIGAIWVEGEDSNGNPHSGEVNSDGCHIIAE